MSISAHFPFHLKSIIEKLGMNILMGAELEFYVTDPQFSLPRELSHIEIKKELGNMQFEAVFPPTFNLGRLALEISRFRFFLRRHASFEAFTTENEPFSSLQFNFSLWKEKSNFSAKNDLLRTPELQNAALFFLLKDLPSHLRFFVKNANCVSRLTNIDSIKKFRNSPFTISAGGKNNRTCALRLIHEKNYKYTLDGKVLKGFRIEHRVPSSNARVFSSILSIINSLQKAYNYEKVLPQVPLLHGNAFEEEIMIASNLKRIIE